MDDELGRGVQPRDDRVAQRLAVGVERRRRSGARPARRPAAPDRAAGCRRGRRSRRRSGRRRRARAARRRRAGRGRGGRRLTIRSATPPVTSQRSALPRPRSAGGSRRSARRLGPVLRSIRSTVAARASSRVSGRSWALPAPTTATAAPGRTWRSSTAHRASRAGRQRSARPASASRLRARFASRAGPRDQRRGSERTVDHDCQVMRRITSEIASPMSGSAICRPSATSAAVATTARLTSPSVRAW